MNITLRKSLALILVLATVLCIIPFYSTAQNGAPRVETVNYTVTYSDTTPGGFLNVENPGSRRISDVMTALNSFFKLSSALPPYYNSNNEGLVTPVKNQAYNDCWAHAAMSVSETNMIKNGTPVWSDGKLGEAATTDLDLSENHLNYFTYSKSYDKLGMLSGDSMTFPETDPFQLGGQSMLSAWTMLRWTGPASETVPALAYNREIDKSYSIDPEYAYDYDVAHLSSAYEIPAYNIEAVKRAIMKYGSGIMNMYMGDYDITYRGDTCAYFYKYSEESHNFTNHSVTVVGWDDNFSRDKFNENNKPENDGAWIIKNSWGAETSDKGYIYISYEDSAVLDNDVVFFEFDLANNYDNNYQYDGTSSIFNYVNFGFTGVANVFTAFGDETLEAVLLGHNDEGLEYVLSIYTDVDEDDPESGILAASQSGMLYYSGAQTIKLEQPVKLSAGTRYSVVFDLSGPDVVNLPVDESITIPEWDNLTITHQGLPKMSFYKMPNYGWTDTGEGGFTFRIKAYTNNDVQCAHDTLDDYTVPATCTSPETTVTYCVDCSAVIDKVENGLPLGHDWAETTCKWADNLSKVTVAHVCKRDSEHLEYEIAPTSFETLESTEEGEKRLYTASFENENFEDQTKTVIISNDSYTPCADDCPGKGFEDMPKKGHWSHDPIDWALTEGITAGTDATHVSPDKVCTRAQVVTFLWAAAGKPEPMVDKNPFFDVEPGSWYYSAVLWAYEYGITAGTDEMHFSPNAECKRAQVVTFLRAASENKDYLEIPDQFEDVEENKWYTDAVLWAYENGITAGTDATHFNPSMKCSRAQIMTFLYSAFSTVYSLAEE